MSFACHLSRNPLAFAPSKQPSSASLRSSQINPESPKFFPGRVKQTRGTPRSWPAISSNLQRTMKSISTLRRLPGKTKKMSLGTEPHPSWLTNTKNSCALTEVDSHRSSPLASALPSCQEASGPRPREYHHAPFSQQHRQQHTKDAPDWWCVPYEGIHPHCA